MRLARVAALAGLAIALAGSGLPAPGEGEQVTLDDPRLALWLPGDVHRVRGELLGREAVIEVGPASRDLSPAPEYAAATAGRAVHVKLLRDGRLAGYVAGQPFPVDAIDCAHDPDAGTQLAWNAALAWEGDGAKGQFIVQHEDGGDALSVGAGYWYKVWLSHRVEPAWLGGQAGRLFEGERRSFAYVVETTTPFDERGDSFTEFRFESADGSRGALDGGIYYDRQSSRCEGLPLEGRHPARALAGTSLVREDLADYSAPVTGSRWRCAGDTEALVPLARPGSNVDPKRSPPRGFEDLRFEPRRVMTLESVPVAAGAPYARRVVVLDRQTMRPVYATTFDEQGMPLRVTLHAWAWSGDDPAGDASWEGVAAARTLLPHRTLVVDVATGARKRIDYEAVRAAPLHTPGQVKRLIDPRPFHCGR